MKFPTDRPVKVVMLGAGGTGGYVAPYVFRLLHMLDRPARFVVCDGDIVEPKNLDRQNFVPADLGENKARVLAERYSTVLGMETEYVPNFIEKLPDLMELIEPKDGDVLALPDDSRHALAAGSVGDMQLTVRRRTDEGEQADTARTLRVTCYVFGRKIVFDVSIA